MCYILNTLQAAIGFTIYKPDFLRALRGTLYSYTLTFWLTVSDTYYVDATFQYIDHVDNQCFSTLQLHMMLMCGDPYDVFPVVYIIWCQSDYNYKPIYIYSANTTWKQKCIHGVCLSVGSIDFTLRQSSDRVNCIKKLVL